MPPRNYPFRTEPSRISGRLAPNLDREAQAARTGVLRVGIRDLELAAEQVFLPLELRPLEVREALRVDEHLHVLLGDDDVRRPCGVREVHPVLHPAATAGDDPQTERGSCWGAIKRIASRPVRTRAVVLSLPPRIARSARGARHSPHVRPKIYITTL